LLKLRMPNMGSRPIGDKQHFHRNLQLPLQGNQSATTQGLIVLVGRNNQRRLGTKIDRLATPIQQPTKLHAAAKDGPVVVFDPLKLAVKSSNVALGVHDGQGSCE
jgi:hypothetical protein